MAPEPVNHGMVGKQDKVNGRAFLRKLPLQGGKVRDEMNVLRLMSRVLGVETLGHDLFLGGEMGQHVFLEEREGLSDLGPPLSLIAGFQQLVDAAEQLLVLCVDIRY